MLNPSIAHALAAVDPLADDSRDEPHRLPHLRACLRAVAKSSAPYLTDPTSERSLGALLAARKDASLGAGVLNCLLSGEATRPPRVCLLGSSVRKISIEEADGLDEKQRVGAIAICGSDKMALSGESQTGELSVRAEVAKEVCGGSKPATMVVERSGLGSVKIHIVSAAGNRRIIPASAVPSQLLDRLFDTQSCKFEPAARVPEKRMELPEFAKVAIVEFLERKVRLQALLTASVPAPASRPVVLEAAHIKDFDSSERLPLVVKATLHQCSSSCVCTAHGLRDTGGGRVEVRLETCGRLLRTTSSGERVCPCHHQAIDASGNARFVFDDCCVEGTRVTVCCMHRSGSQFRRGVFLDEITLNDGDREELSAILMNCMKYFGSIMGFYKGNKPCDTKGIMRVQSLVAEELRRATSDASVSQLVREDSEVTNAREMLQRDMGVVDLLRERGVFRHRVKRGDRKGSPYLKRDRGEPLTKFQSDLCATHAHLFRKAM